MEALRPLIVGERLESARIQHVFFLRSAEPPIGELEGRTVESVERCGKRIVVRLEHDLYMAFHLMLTGRLRWRDRAAPIPRKVGLGAFDFPNGTLLVTEYGSRKRASLHLAAGRDALARLLPPGIDPLEAELSAFAEALTRENHTLKRALTDQRLIAGIGNTYSDEILHRARLSPFKLTRQLSDADLSELFRSTRAILTEWLEVLRDEAGEGFPEKADALRPDRAVHGKYGEPCPECGSPVQRISFARGECNYCATCQTGGKLLADRSLSRLLKEDWPSTIEELEERRAGR